MCFWNRISQMCVIMIEQNRRKFVSAAAGRAARERKFVGALIVCRSWCCVCWFDASTNVRCIEPAAGRAEASSTSSRTQVLLEDEFFVDVREDRAVWSVTQRCSQSHSRQYGRNRRTIRKRHGIRSNTEWSWLNRVLIVLIRVRGQKPSAKKW